MDRKPDHHEQMLEAMESCRPGSDDLRDPALTGLAAAMAIDPGLADRFERQQRADMAVRDALRRRAHARGLGRRLLERLAEAQAEASPLSLLAEQITAPAGKTASGSATPAVLAPLAGGGGGGAGDCSSRPGSRLGRDAWFHCVYPMDSSGESGGVLPKRITCPKLPIGGCFAAGRLPPESRGGADAASPLAADTGLPGPSGSGVRPGGPRRPEGRCVAGDALRGLPRHSWDSFHASPYGAASLDGRLFYGRLAGGGPAVRPGRGRWAGRISGLSRSPSGPLT